MIPVSFGHILVEYLQLWIRNNKNSNPFIIVHSSTDQFWERGELFIDLTKFSPYYFNRFIVNNPEKYCDNFTEKIKEQLSQFIFEADFTTIQLKISFRNVGMLYSCSITAGPKGNHLNC